LPLEEMYNGVNGVKLELLIPFKLKFHSIAFSKRYSYV
jgi:hypothetical protein